MKALARPDMVEYSASPFQDKRSGIGAPETVVLVGLSLEYDTTHASLGGADVG